MATIRAVPLPYPVPSSTSVTAVMKANRKSDTKPELRLRSELHRRGLRYRLRRAIVAEGLRVIPDVVFRRRQVAVFVDGCFWHRCPEHGVAPKRNTEYWEPKLLRNVERDRRVDIALAAAGWTVVRVWEHEPPFEAANRVIAAVAPRVRPA